MKHVPTHLLTQRIKELELDLAAGRIDSGSYALMRTMIVQELVRRSLRAEAR